MKGKGSLLSYLADTALDGGPDYLVANVANVHLCSQEPTTYEEATSTYSLGNKTAGVTKGDGTPNGRAVTMAAFVDGTQTDAGTATHYAWTDGSDELILTEALVSSVELAGTGAFPLSACVCRFADATQA